MYSSYNHLSCIKLLSEKGQTVRGLLFFFAKDSVNVMAKSYAKQFYSSKAWQDCRNGYARSVSYLCENCLRRGVYRLGEIVHHRIEIDPVTINNPEVALNWNNLELLCRECHAEAHDGRKKDRRYIIGADGKIILKK